MILYVKFYLRVPLGYVLHTNIRIGCYVHFNGRYSHQVISKRVSVNMSYSSPYSLAGWGPSHLVASSTFIVNSLHLPLSSAMVFHSWLFVPALSRSRLTQSFHRSFGLPVLLPPSSAFQALFNSLSSPILCTCPAHIILFPTTFIFRCFFSQFLHLIFLLSVSSPPVSLSVPTRICRLVPRRFPTLFLLVVSSFFCPT